MNFCEELRKGRRFKIGIDRGESLFVEIKEAASIVDSCGH